MGFRNAHEAFCCICTICGIFFFFLHAPSVKVNTFPDNDVSQKEASASTQKHRCAGLLLERMEALGPRRLGPVHVLSLSLSHYLFVPHRA